MTLSSLLSYIPFFYMKFVNFSYRVQLCKKLIPFWPPISLIVRCKCVILFLWRTDIRATIRVLGAFCVVVYPHPLPFCFLPFWCNMGSFSCRNGQKYCLWGLRLHCVLFIFKLAPFDIILCPFFTPTECMPWKSRINPTCGELII